MSELIKLLKEAIGPRPLLPLILILLAGYLFKAGRDYPVRELFYDRWYLLTVLSILFASVVFIVFTSGLADRTPEGTYGIYVGRFRGDPSRSLHTRLTEALRANLDIQTRNKAMRVDVKDLKREVDDSEIDRPDAWKALNAAVVAWGVAVDGDSIYMRLWSPSTGTSRMSEPLKVTDISQLAAFSSQVWDRIQQQATGPQPESKSEADIQQLQRDVKELRTMLTAMAPNRLDSPQRHKEALLVGIGNYASPDLPRLAGPRNDVEAFHRLLVDRFGFGQASITILVDSEATRSGIRSSLEKVADAATVEDTVFIYFSGHGIGTSIVPYDGKAKDNLVDMKDYVARVLAKHAKTIFVFDANIDPFPLPSDVGNEAAILFAKSQGQSTYETTSSDGPAIHGAFTQGLLQALAVASVSSNWKDLIDAATAYVSLKLPNQHPSLVAGPHPPPL